MAISLAKESEAVKNVLAKSNFLDTKVNVEVDADISGSMDWRFSQGVVQDIITKMLAVGMNIDVDGSIVVTAFNDKAFEIGKVTKSNIDGFIDKVFLRKVEVRGSTKYSTAMEKIINKYKKAKQEKGFLTKLFGKKDDFDPTLPTIVFFITDGNNDYDDYARTKQLLIESSNMPIFWQFIGIGSGKRSDFPFLAELDTMGGRTVDNANFFPANTDMTNDDLYEKILGEFPFWVNVVKKNGIL